MSIFRITTGSSALDVTGGVPVTLLEGITWIERYRAFGEFTITTRLYSGVLEALPIGSIIGHLGLLDLMMVENHEVQESGTNDPLVTITGRSLDAITDFRVAGASHQVGSSVLTDYTINPSGTNYATTLVKELLDNELVGASDSDDILANLAVVKTGDFGTQYSDPVVISKGILTGAVKTLLEQDDLGLKVVRPHTFESLWTPKPTSKPTIFVHQGNDVSNEVSFSYEQGDIEQANYLWSNKAVKNAVLVTSTYFSVLIDTPGFIGYDRRYTTIDASDLDDRENTAPSGTTKTDILAQMTTRGNEVLASNNLVKLIEVDITKSNTYQYEKDYAIGDIVNVNANHGVRQKMRVIEYATIYDDRGSSGFPTLSNY